MTREHNSAELAPSRSGSPRCAAHQRTTCETSVEVELCLDGKGESRVETPIGFLSHMVEQLPRHALWDLRLRAQGDTHIDGHHTTEDTALCLGAAFRAALGAKAGILRYGWCTLPMDEARVSCAVDLSGRTYFVWDVELPKGRLGEFDTELAEVFFEGFCRGAECNLHVELHRGRNLHHIIEIAFKSLARSLRQAASLDPQSSEVPSTKGTLSE